LQGITIPLRGFDNFFPLVTISHSFRTAACRMRHLFHAVAAVVLLGCTASAQPIHQASPLGLDLTWTLPLGSMLAASPAYDETQAYVPLGDGRLVAVSLVQGRIAWTARQPSSIAPAAGDGLVFVGAGAEIVALSAAEGVERWRFTLESPMAVPLRWDGAWLLACDETGQVHALRTSDGERIWQRELGVVAHRIPTAGMERLYVPLRDGRIVALELGSGEIAWERKLGGPPTEVLLAGDRLFVGSDDNFFYSLVARNGSVRWRWRTGGDLVGAAVVDRNSVFFTSRDNLLRALHISRGWQQWTRNLETRPASGPLFLRDQVLVAGIAPDIHFYARRDGSPTGALVAPDELAAPPHVRPRAGLGSPSIVVATVDGSLVAFGVPVDPPAVPLSTVPGRPWPPEQLDGLERSHPAGAGELSNCSLMTAERRLTPSTIRSGVGAENESRIKFAPLPSTKKALPVT
jgi:outer membrane protein assembly factor BamB